MLTPIVRCCKFQELLMPSASVPFSSLAQLAVLRTSRRTKAAARLDLWATAAWGNYLSRTGWHFKKCVSVSMNRWKIMYRWIDMLWIQLIWYDLVLGCDQLVVFCCGLAGANSLCSRWSHWGIFQGDVLSILLGRDGTPKDAKGSKGVYTLC